MIDNPRSPRVRGVAKLAKRDARAHTGLFLLEGPQAVDEALRFRPELLVELYATPTALDRYPEIAQAAAAAGLDVEFVTEEVLDSMADTVTPQGIVAACRQFPTSAKDLFSGEPKLIAILEEVRDPGNAGTIIRAADAAGADGVILTGRSVDLYNPKVVRATTGSLFHLPVAIGGELEAVIERAHAAGMQVVAADIKGSDLLDRAQGRPPGAADGVAVRQRGPRPHRRELRSGRPRHRGADLRRSRVDEPCDGRLRVPVRERVRPARLAARARRLFAR